MEPTSKSVVRTYILITLLSTLATSLIWGVDTLFLLDAGLSIAQVFLVNAFFMVGQLLFEVPTGIVADSKGRKLSFLLGCATLALVTGINYVFWQTDAPVGFWIATSILLGLGFTFFSGATEAWLVDALAFTKYKGSLDSVFAKGQVAGGVAMLSGSVLGGVVAQLTNLSGPYIIRALLLIVTFALGCIYMKDLGFEPDITQKASVQIKKLWQSSVHYGLKNVPIRMIILSSIFSMTTGYFAFYALQPYLLELFKDPNAYSIAGLAAALIAGSRIVGGLLAPRIRLLFKKRTSHMLFGLTISALCLFAFGLVGNFWLALLFVLLWGFMFATVMPVRQAYINGLIPSKQRATILSFDSMISSGGSALLQPGLGRIANSYSYSTAYLVCGSLQLLSLPFILLARRQHAFSDNQD